jgi:hypothetical protein
MRTEGQGAMAGCAPTRESSPVVRIVLAGAEVRTSSDSRAAEREGPGRLLENRVRLLRHRGLSPVRAADVREAGPPPACSAYFVVLLPPRRTRMTKG